MSLVDKRRRNRLPGQRGKSPSVPEIGAIMALADRGIAQADIARLMDRGASTIARVLAGARESLEVSAGWYVDQHKVATAIAALRGDSKPAQWALERLAVVRPVEPAAGSSGLTVRIGVLLPGLGEGAVLAGSVGVVAAEPVESDS